MPLYKNQTIPLKITGLSSDGNGIGKFDGMAVFVPFSAPGDELVVRIVKPSPSYAFGIIETIVTPSEYRITPDCDIFGKCGGCAFRHVAYDEELRQKRVIVSDSFLHIGKISVPVAETLPSPNVDRYRNKVQIPVDSSGDEVYTGFYAGRSHRVIPCKDCMLQPEIFTDISQLICMLLSKFKISTYNESKHTGIVRHVFLRHSVTLDKVMVCFVINKKRLPFQEDIIAQLTESFPQISTIAVNINREKTNVVLGEKCITLWGDDELTDEMSGVPVKLNPLSFYQVNTKGAEQLYAVAAAFANLSKDDVLLDLYCGAGTIGLSMAHFCKKLIGVEIIPQAIENAIENAKQMNLDNTEFICADASETAERLLYENVKPNVIILDPPRKGCEEGGLLAVCNMAPERIIMVSCSPATAARDCAYLQQNDYIVSAVQPVDMFPRTKHVEVIVEIRRK